MILTVSPLGCPENGHFYYYLKYLGQFDTNYINFKNVENFKKYFFQIKKYCEGKLVNI
jgi:predicted nucleotide-binding protein (sugar kinase/HSP70/actin superfamily)